MANWRRRAGRSSVFFTTDAFDKSPKGLRRLQCADSGHRIKAELERPAPSRWRSEKRKRSGGEAAGKVQPPSAPLSCHRVSGDPGRLVSGVGRGRGGPRSQSVPEVFRRARRDWLAMTSCCSSGWGQSRRGRLLQRQ
ncbi:uncharacterized protein LOC144292948 [Canis aureus]